MEHEQIKEYYLLTLQSLLRHSPDMIFIKDTDLVYVGASDSFARLLGLQTGEELVGKTDFDLFSPELARQYTQDDQAILSSGGEACNYLEPLPDAGEDKHYSSTSKFAIRDSSGRVIGLYGLGRDVTAQVQLEAAQESSRMSRQMFDDVLEADLTENRMLFVEDSKLERFLQVTDQSCYAQTVQMISSRLVHPDFEDEFLRLYDRSLLMTGYHGGRREFTHMLRLRMAPGCQDHRWVECSTRVYYSRVSNTMRMTTFLQDVDEEVRRKQQLERRATTDALTGLWNRVTILERIAAFLAGEEGVGRLHALLFLDLDRFKQANDRWGHRFGDQVLRETARRLREQIRGEDMLGRIGGDEFLVFFRCVNSRRSVEQMASRLLKALPTFEQEGKETVRVTCSVGIALSHGGGGSVERLYEQADMAMYRAKEKGRNQLFFFEDMLEPSPGETSAQDM